MSAINSQTVVVPAEPTDEMARAFFNATPTAIIEPRFYTAYRAMLAAAPKSDGPAEGSALDRLEAIFRKGSDAAGWHWTAEGAAAVVAQVRRDAQSEARAEPVAWIYTDKEGIETITRQPPDRVTRPEDYAITPLFATSDEG